MHLADFREPLALDLVVFVLGICIGSFLNVLALRSLSEESIFWPPSKCPRCDHRLSPLDNIPVVSWLFLRGKCRYCSAPISWQYPAVELCTGLIFVLLIHVFLDFPNSPFNSRLFNGWVGSFFPQATSWLIAETNQWNGIINPAVQPVPGFSWPTTADQKLPYALIGAAFLACTLIAVTVTDFREKLIPHEITYPSMIIGLIFSAVVREDLLGALAGVGASYMLFDFIAFYGLKVYLATHGGTEETPRRRRLRRLMSPRKRRKAAKRLRWRLDLATIDRGEQEEPMEVMGGGDAVLSAVMSAYFGWQLLVIALLIGFLAGTAMGLGLLISEMSKAKLLHKAAINAFIFAAVGATAFGLLGYTLASAVEMSGGIPAWLSMGILGAVGGSLLGVVSIGTQVSKPYPFGPALALGGFISLFLIPNWLYLHAIASTQH